MGFQLQAPCGVGGHVQLITGTTMFSLLLPCLIMPRLRNPFRDGMVIQFTAKHVVNKEYKFDLPLDDSVTQVHPRTTNLDASVALSQSSQLH